MILGFSLVGIIVYSVGNNKSSLAIKNKIYDNSQYLSQTQPLASPQASASNLRIINGETLESSAPSFLVSGEAVASLYGGGNNFGNKEGNEIKEYIVQKGDTLTSIAKKFSISLNTILWANHLSSKSVLKQGQKLTILPVSGLLHVVKQGDTLSEIASLYKSKVKDIESINGIQGEKIFTGDILIVPNGVMPKRTDSYYKTVPLANSYFICPIPAPCRITQGLHWFNAVDFSNGKCGEPVFAAAGGKVQRTGYTSLGGNYVRIIHPNGVVTYYGHLSKITVLAGENVYQGEVIGYVGHTGYTIPRGPAGCHVHFDVRFAKNPFAKYPVGTEVALLGR